MNNKLKIVIIYVKSILFSTAYKTALVVILSASILFSFVAGQINPVQENHVGFLTIDNSSIERRIFEEFAASENYKADRYHDIEVMKQDISKGTIVCGFYINPPDLYGKYDLNGIATGIFNTQADSTPFIMESMQATIFKVMAPDTALQRIEKVSPDNSRAKIFFNNNLKAVYDSANFMRVEIIKKNGGDEATQKSSNKGIMLAIISSCILGAAIIIANKAFKTAGIMSLKHQKLYITLALFICYVIMGMILGAFTLDCGIARCLISVLTLAVISTVVSLACEFSRINCLYLVLPITLISFAFSQTIISFDTSAQASWLKFFSASWYYLKALAIV